MTTVLASSAAFIVLVLLGTWATRKYQGVEHDSTVDWEIWLSGFAAPGWRMRLLLPLLHTRTAWSPNNDLYYYKQWRARRYNLQDRHVHLVTTKDEYFKLLYGKQEDTP